MLKFLRGLNMILRSCCDLVVAAAAAAVVAEVSLLESYSHHGGED